MDEQRFKDKFNELLSKIQELPVDQRQPLEQLAEETRERRERIQRSVSELQESLDFLRLSVKYLVFDLEATRRENGYLRKLVSEANGQPEGHDQDENSQREDDDDNFLAGDF